MQDQGDRTEEQGRVYAVNIDESVQDTIVITDTQLLDLVSVVFYLTLFAPILSWLRLLSLGFKLDCRA